MSAAALKGSGRPTICLNMIVKNESSVIADAIESVAPYIDYWVIVDTGSTDGTQDLILDLMRQHGIPGVLHERPWKDFGYNRSEALRLAQGSAEYIWMFDADDVLEGTLELSGLTADGYLMRYVGASHFWRFGLFRDGVAWSYEGVTHENAICDDPGHTREFLAGDYFIAYRQLGSSDSQAAKLKRDLALLLQEVAQNPADARSVFYLGRTYEALGDYAKAYDYFAKRAEMGTEMGGEHDVYQSMFKSAQMMDLLGRPWAEIQDAYLRAWAFRPIRAEPLHAIAYRYRSNGQYDLGHLFATRAAEIPLPETEQEVLVATYQWCAKDEQAVCASWIGRQAEAVTIWRRLLTYDCIPNHDRERIVGNRDWIAAQLLETAAGYDEGLTRRPDARKDAEVTVTLFISKETVGAAERTLNSLLRCCIDSARIGRFLAIADVDFSDRDQATLAQSYPFLDFVTLPDADLNLTREQIHGRYWLHLWHGWRFFTDEALITRLIDVLEAESHLVQVGINLNDAHGLTSNSPARSNVRTTPRGCRYLLSDIPTVGPAMFDMTRLTDDAGLLGATATLDEVLCIHF